MGRFFCWGDNDNGQLGDGNKPTDSGVPVEIDMSTFASDQFDSLSSARPWGANNVCAILSSTKEVFCWGDNAYGQVGDGTINTDRTTPVKIDMSAVAENNSFKQISSSRYSTCAIHTGDKLFCWGSGVAGRTANNVFTNQLTPIEVDMSALAETNQFSHVSAGENHVCAVYKGTPAKLFCSGSNSYGRLGAGTSLGAPIFVPVDTTNF